MKRQAGFTIIELGVVIALLGVLAAVALPRFIDVTSDAHRAAVQGSAGGLGAAVVLVKAQGVVDNTPPSHTVEIDGIFIRLNANRFPVSTAGAAVTTGTTVPTVNAQNCLDVWNAVLQGSRPTVGITSTVSDYLVTAATPICTYILYRHRLHLL